MPLITALLSALSRRLGSLVRAVFGWVILGLFGRLSTAKQTGLSVALILSLAWPLLVLGVFLPGLAARLLAFVPLERWIGAGPLRVVWTVLAIVAPLVVGLIARWAAPDRKLRGSWLRTMLFGFPLSLGFAISFLITLVVVPATRLATMVRGWREEHVFLQAKEGCYRRVLEQLGAVAEQAGIEVRECPVPAWRGLATRAIKWFARGALDAIVPDDPRMLRGKGIEASLYPADLLLRGEPETIARFRVGMAETMPLDAAHLTSDPDAQEVEEELAGLWGVVLRHEDAADIGGAANSRLRAIADELRRRNMPFEQFMLLFANLHRLEVILGGGDTLVSADPHRMPAQGATHMPVIDPHEAAPTTELLREALQDTKELVRLEVALARREAAEELRGLKLAVIGLGVAAAAGVTALSLALVALALAIAPTPLPVLVIALVMLAVAAAAGIAGYKALPRKPMAETRRRLETDARTLKERMA